MRNAFLSSDVFSIKKLHSIVKEIEGGIANYQSEHPSQGNSNEQHNLLFELDGLLEKEEIYWRQGNMD